MSPKASRCGGGGTELDHYRLTSTLLRFLKIGYCERILDSLISVVHSSLDLGTALENPNSGILSEFVATPFPVAVDAVDLPANGLCI